MAEFTIFMAVLVVGFFFYLLHPVKDDVEELESPADARTRRILSQKLWDEIMHQLK
jgi:hypothetical protein